VNLQETRTFERDDWANGGGCCADETSGAGLACGVRVKRSLSNHSSLPSTSLAQRSGLNGVGQQADETSGAGLAYGVRVKRSLSTHSSLPSTLSRSAAD